MYDIDRDGRLSKEDVQETLKMMVNQYVHSSHLFQSLRLGR